MKCSVANSIAVDWGFAQGDHPRKPGQPSDADLSEEDCLLRVTIIQTITIIESINIALILYPHDLSRESGD